MGTEEPDKRTELLRLLDDGLVMVHLDPRTEGVEVPAHLTADPVLRLNLAYGFNLPSLEIDEEGVYAVLSFGGRDFGCWLPWSSIFAITLPDQEHQGCLWPEDLPDELDPLFESVRHLNRDSAAPAIIAPPQENPFSVIEGGGVEPKALAVAAEPESSTDFEESPHLTQVSSPASDEPAKAGSHLRLVKG